jgi:hypothetical protein
LILEEVFLRRIQERRIQTIDRGLFVESEETEEGDVLT